MVHTLKGYKRSRRMNPRQTCTLKTSPLIDASIPQASMGISQTSDAQWKMMYWPLFRENARNRVIEESRRYQGHILCCFRLRDWYLSGTLRDQSKNGIKLLKNTSNRWP